MLLADILNSLGRYMNLQISEIKFDKIKQILIKKLLLVFMIYLSVREYLNWLLQGVV